MRSFQLANLHPDNDRIRQVQIHGSVLAVLAGDEQRTHTVHWLRMDDGTELHRAEVPCAPDPALSPDLAVLAWAELADDGSQIVLERPRDPERPQRVIPFPDWSGGGPPDSCSCLAFSGDGGILRVSFSDGSLFSWDVRAAFDGAPLPWLEVQVEEYPPVRAFAHGAPPSLSGVEAHLIACDGAMVYMRVPDRSSDPVDVGRLNEPSRAAAFAPDGTAFAVAFSDRVLLWETNLPSRPPLRATVLLAQVAALAFSADSRALATASADGQVRTWGRDGSGPLSSRDWGIGRLGGIAYSEDGCTCVAGGDGGRLVVWDLADELAPPAQPAAPPPPPAPAPPPRRRKPKAGPPPSPPPVSGEVAWVAVRQGEFPVDAAVAGHEADGTPLYAARARHKGNLIPGKARPAFGGANVAHGGKEVTVRSFEVLVGQPTWLPWKGAGIPQGAIPCGHDKQGQQLYLARAAVGPGMHPGKLGPETNGAVIPFGGIEFKAEEYEVLVSAATLDVPQQQQAVQQTAPLLSWDFENVMSERGVSTSVGVPSEPLLVSGFVSQTGGGPAEVFGQEGTVFLTRHLGSNDVFLWFTVTKPVVLEGVSFRHWHNHNPGYPTHPAYEVLLQLDEGEGYQNVGQPLTLSNDNSGGTDAIAFVRRLEPGSYKLRWHPHGLRRGRDTSSEFFAMKDVRLLGRVLE